MAALTPELQNEYEAQADLCLQVAVAERVELLDLGQRLTGDAEKGNDLYTDSLLNCHSFIQRRGLPSGGDAPKAHKAYLIRAMIHLHWSNTKQAKRQRELTERDYLPEEGGADAEGLAQLEEDIAGAVWENFAPRDAEALMLHAQGYTLQQISAVTNGGHLSRIQRRLARMKEQLRQTFGPAWVGLFE
jgi:DNA-directed RNA polymerase specialized sigma24 family protein